MFIYIMLNVRPDPLLFFVQIQLVFTLTPNISSAVWLGPAVQALVQVSHLRLFLRQLQFEFGFTDKRSLVLRLVEIALRSQLDIVQLAQYNCLPGKGQVITLLCEGWRNGEEG